MPDHVRAGGPSEGCELATLRTFDQVTGEFNVLGAHTGQQWVLLQNLKRFKLQDDAEWRCGWVSAAKMREHITGGCPCTPYASRIPDKDSEDEAEDAESVPEGLADDRPMTPSNSVRRPCGCKHSLGARRGSQL